MPYINRTRRPRRAKRTKKKRPRRIKRKARMGHSLGFPANNRIQLRYCANVSLADVVGGVLDLHAFSANNVFDPDVTGVGHQPLGRDQWALFYNHYRVVESTCNVKMTTTSVGSGQPVMTGVYLADDVNVPSEWTTLAESGRSNPLMHTPGNTESHMIKSSYSQSKFFKGQGVNQSALGASIGSSPSEQAYFIIYAQAADESSTFTSRSYSVTIDYVVEFSEPKDLTQS